MNVGINGASGCGGRWMLSQQGRVETSTVSAGEQPRFLGRMSFQSLPQGQLAGTLFLLWSFCHLRHPYLLVNEHHVTSMEPQPHHHMPHLPQLTSLT